MRVPLTKYGWPQVLVFPLAALAGMVIYPLIAVRFFPYWARFTPWAILTFWTVEFILCATLIWVLTFFRDPERAVAADRNLLMAPADGKVTDIEIVEESDFIGGATLRIGIFLSIFDVHINRAPCNVTVEKVRHKEGKYRNAMNPESGRVNESNDLYLLRTDSPRERLVVRQISGAVARRIVCQISEGQELAGGEKFGMIKFGSRTEIYVPAGKGTQGNRVGKRAGEWEPRCLVKVGDKVKAGLSPLVRYEECRD